MNDIYDISIEAMKVLFLVGIPVVVSALVGGVVAMFLQSVISMYDPVVGYACRLGAVVLTLYFLSPAILSSSETLLSLAMK